MQPTLGSEARSSMMIWSADMIVQKASGLRTQGGNRAAASRGGGVVLRPRPLRECAGKVRIAGDWMAGCGKCAFDGAVGGGAPGHAEIQHVDNDLDHIHKLRSGKAEGAAHSRQGHTGARGGQQCHPQRQRCWAATSSLRAMPKSSLAAGASWANCERT